MKVKLTAILENNEHPEGLKDIKDLRELEQKMVGAYQIMFDLLIFMGGIDNGDKVTVVSADIIEE